MSIVEKMERLKKRFDASISSFEDKQNEIKEIQNDQRIMQGEYKVLLELGIEAGVLDMDGNVVKEKLEEEPVGKQANPILQEEDQNESKGS